METQCVPAVERRRHNAVSSVGLECSPCLLLNVLNVFLLSVTLSNIQRQLASIGSIGSIFAKARRKEAWTSGRIGGSGFGREGLAQIESGMCFHVPNATEWNNAHSISFRQKGGPGLTIFGMSIVNRVVTHLKGGPI